MKFNFRIWFWVNCFAWILGIVLSLIISEPIESSFEKPIQFYLGLTMGLSMGLAQYFLIRKVLSVSWIIYSSLLLGGGMLLVECLSIGGVQLQLPLSVFAGALTLSVWQVKYLKLSIKLAKHWIFSSLSAWILSVTAVLLINCTMKIRSSELNLLIAVVNLLLIFSGGVFHGILTFYPMKKIVEDLSK